MIEVRPGIMLTVVAGVESEASDKAGILSFNIVHLTCVGFSISHVI